jgi:NADH pyrophosphatase NudC (nudix superfamily)
MLCPDAACGYVHWDNPVPIVAALVELDGRIVLARNVAWPEKSFGLVTGFLERDEAPESAVAREVAEELGLATISADLIGLYPFPRMNQLIIAYHVVASGDIVLNEELAEIRMVAPDRVKPWDFGTGLAVRDWLAARPA